MGYPMAVNLRSKIGRETTIVVYDTNVEACKRFQAEESKHGSIEIVDNAYEAILAAVR